MLRSEVIDSAVDARRVTAEWRRLSDENRRPFCNPEWMLAWWEDTGASERGELRVVVVRDGDEVCGLAPLYRENRTRGLVHYRFLGSGTSLRGEPLAVAARRRDVARCTATALRSLDGRVRRIAFEGVPASSRWPELLAGEWTAPRAARPLREWSIPAPVLALEGRTFEEWFSSRSSNFRQQMRRHRGQLEKQGAIFRMTRSEKELGPDLAAFAALHHARWRDRGGSSTLSPPVERMLFHAGRQMLDDGRFRLWSLEIDGEIVSSHLFVAAGGEVAYWLGGFDDRWADQKPSLQVLLAAIEDAWMRNDVRVDLGGGGQDYKYRFTDDDERLEWCAIVPPGLRHVFARAAVATVPLRRKALARLSPENQARLRGLLGRGR